MLPGISEIGLLTCNIAFHWRHQQLRVYPRAMIVHPPVQVSAGDPSGLSNLGDKIALPDPVSFLNQYPTQMQK